MRTHGGNVGVINRDIGKITFDTLEKFGIPYDEIYFGKPHADIYIDDLALNCCENLEKELGFYNSKIDTRYFNSIHNSELETITKKGNVRGENYYYMNIPNEIKDMFPIYVYGSDNLICIEKVKCVTATDLYLSKIMNEKILNHILGSISRIQAVENNNLSNQPIDIYNNYGSKLRSRYNAYNYTKFKDAEIIYKDLLYKLNIYTNCRKGKQSIIHGDPVFSNILINEHGKIKCIDMRGCIGDVLAIEGDSLYDWSKIYQSLIGYDEILQDKSLDTSYKEHMIEMFKVYFMDKYSREDFENLKLITKSLLFSLIPLHDNKKCQDYFNLISCKYLK
jgi:hypothetical protein